MAMVPELAGVTPKYSEEEQRAHAAKATLANAAGRFIREQFPGLKIIVGNTSGTARIMADLLLEKLATAASGERDG